MTVMKFDVIVNPAGAGGEAMKVWQKTERILKEKGADYEVWFSEPDLSVEEITASLTDGDRETRLIVLGGDGTFNEAVNGIRDFGKTMLGLIPCGSGNDLARGLGLPPFRRLMDIMLEGKTVRMSDVGEVRLYTAADEALGRAVPSDTVRRFNVSCGIGYDAEICALAERSRFKNVLNRIRLGKMIYLLEGTQLIFRAKKYPVRITYDGGREISYPECLFAVAMNHRYEGGGVMFCPHADAQDGLLDLCIANGQNSRDFFRIVPHTYTGRHLRYEGVYEERSASVRIRSEVPLWLHTDGEVKQATDDAEIRILKGKLKLLV